MKAQARTTLFSLIGKTLSTIPHHYRRPAAPRLLVIKPDHFGDVLLTSPAIHQLRTTWPRARITIAVSRQGAQVAHHIPSIDEVLTVAFPGLGREPQQPLVSRWLTLLSLAFQWRNKFDIAFLLRDDYYWGALLTAIAGIPERYGTATPLCAPLLTSTVPPQREHTTRHHLRVVALATATAVPPHWSPPYALRFTTSASPSQAQQLLHQHRLDAKRPFLLLHPGSGSPVKLWPTACWAIVIRHAFARYGLHTAVVAGQQEQRLAQQIGALAPDIVTTVPPLPLDALATLMQQATVVLGVDSGPSHLAAALDVPSIRLYGPADVHVYGPWADPVRHRSLQSPLLCSPCDRLFWDILDIPLASLCPAYHSRQRNDNPRRNPRSLQP
ncbi:MAG: glycosyltransferase family 9 protein [Chloroflexi bacterium]|nr:glycosyltransferase family 9 protein [Chloroflexota bacterium]